MEIIITLQIIFTQNLFFQLTTRSENYDNHSQYVHKVSNNVIVIIIWNYGIYVHNF